MKNTLLDIYEKDSTRKVLSSLLSIFVGLFVGAIVVVIVGLTKETITGEELMNFVRRPSEESAETAEAAVPAEAATEITAAAQTEVPTEPEE